MELKIENMTCGGCARAVAKAIQSVDPDASVEANPEARTVRVETTASAASLRQALQQAGYPAAAN
ncbi:heavy-metal-associated domain-containing protein [Nitratireductor sp. ZSWI3]|uniref:heavy-metal-associated domain-containing protein n=1 Tax=Nitratireductor sp. ZSWI3 TaxID=2966359 RepID=UPI0021504A63|nr:heavy-metal-associated domain-containing protein [Nitratireductor sp. ZSWI3]MCR4264763.1 heavy-metal-associated domain-containing protein [Nitratireductor sp. ZSWI3]